MANTCTKCNFENTDNALVCQGCGAELASPVKQKKAKVKQNQDPAIRTFILIVLAAAIVLCLITFVQYIVGRQPLLIQNQQNDMANITFTNSWKIWGEFFGNILDFDFTNPNTVYYVCRIICHIYGAFFYFVLSALLSLTAYFVFAKSRKAKLFSIISGCAGLGVIIIGLLLGYFLVVRNAAGIQYSRALPQLTALILFPLFAQLPLLGLMLPKKENQEKSQNNA